MERITESVLVSPVPVEEGLAQTLGAGLVEPLQAAPALQHFQVPPEGAHRTVTSRQSPLTAPNPGHHRLPPLQHCCPCSLSSIPGDSCTTSGLLVPEPPPSVLTPQDHRSNSSSAAGCSDVPRPSPAPSVRTAGRASCPAWPGHRGPSSVHLPSAETRQASSEAGEERLGRGGGGTLHRKVPLPWWRWQRCTGGRPRTCPRPLQGPGPSEHGSPGDKLNNDIDGRALTELKTPVY